MKYSLYDTIAFMDRLRQQEASLLSWVKKVSLFPMVLAITVSMLSALTYGGLVYLGATQLFTIHSMVLHVVCSVVIIGSSLFSFSLVFACSWLVALKERSFKLGKQMLGQSLGEIRAWQAA